MEKKIAELLASYQHEHYITKYDYEPDIRSTIAGFIMNLNIIMDDKSIRSVESLKSCNTYASMSGKYMNFLYPDTFEIPSDEEIKDIKIEKPTSVKIMLRSDENGVFERFWIKLEEINLELKYAIGRVDNELVLNNLEVGESILFHTDCIIDIM